MLSVIVAVASDGAIGRAGTLPWHLPEDLKHFRRLTKGHTMLMGLNTFISLPKVLPGRKHIVIADDPTYSFDHPDVIVKHELIPALLEAKAAQEEIFIIGGGSIYRQAMPYADKLYLTRIDTVIPDADTFFPEVSEEDWQAVKEGDPLTDPETGWSFRYVDYIRRPGEGSQEPEQL